MTVIFKNINNFFKSLITNSTEVRVKSDLGNFKINN